MSKKPDALGALREARETAMARAKEEEAAKPAQTFDEDLDETECFVRLVIAMYTYGLKLAMGVMPDGMAIFIRLSVPSNGLDTHAGMVSFVVSDDTLGVLRKAVQALQAEPKPPYWKADQYAR